MKDLTKSDQLTKSPLIFLSLMGLLVIATLVVASEYFLRPQIEAELKKENTHSFAALGSSKILKQKNSKVIKK